MRRVKKKIRTFRDLVVYQRTKQAALDINSKIIPLLDNDSVLREKVQKVSLEIPRMISEAHSKRFDRPVYSLKLMVEIMALANEAIVLLEQIKGMEEQEEQSNQEEQSEQEEIPRALINKIIREYEMSRKKILHLSRSWKKYYVERKQTKSLEGDKKAQIIKEQQEKIKELEKKLKQALKSK